MRGHSHLFIVCLTAALVSGSGTLAASREQTLVNTTLRPADDAESLITGLIDMFAGGDAGKPRGSIDRVVVKEDKSNRLVLSVATRGLDALQLTAEVRGQNRERQAQIRAVPAAIAGAAAETALALELREEIGDRAIESAYLRVTVIDPRRGNQAAAVRAFRLPKRWAGTAATTVRVAATPVGAAANLGPRPDYAPPPKVLIPVTPVRGDVIVRDHRGAARGAAVAMERPQAPPPVAVRDAASMRVMQAQRKTTIEKTKNVTAALPSSRLLQLEQFQYGIRPEDAQKGAQGPGPSPIELLEGLRAEDIKLNPARLVQHRQPHLSRQEPEVRHLLLPPARVSPRMDARGRPRDADPLRRRNRRRRARRRPDGGAAAVRHGSLGSPARDRSAERVQAAQSVGRLHRAAAAAAREGRARRLDRRCARPVQRSPRTRSRSPGCRTCSAKSKSRG